MAIGHTNARRRTLGRGVDDAYLAHVVEDGNGVLRTHALADHLRDAGDIAADFAATFAAEEWARLAGRLHDFGKYQAAFQQYLRDATGISADASIEVPGRVDHSTVGAIYAMDRLGAPMGHLLAYAIAGHHAGLPDWRPGGDSASSALDVRLQKRELLEATLRAHIPADIKDIAGSALPELAAPDSVHLWVRMLFSCLVDADSLDTERFKDQGRSAHRSRWRDIADLRELLDDHLERLRTDGPIDALRTAIRRQCVAKAELPRGVYSLTVPTGGGKTLTSLDFALAHASANGQRRVIYAVPYISIIEQTAETFRSVFGEEGVVLEHHSNLDPDEVTLQAQLAAENWDAPIVVTTTVQLFESLFAARRGACRKLHNIAGSVVILDEAQLLPPKYLEPIVSVLRELAHGYGVTVLLSTATQPALASHDGFGKSFNGFDDVRELVDDPRALWPRLERVRVEWPSNLDLRSEWDDVADWLRAERQVLCVVNSRADCRELTGRLPDDAVHLSALMCPAHRSIVIGGIKAMLKAGDPLRVVSTQLVEAGVDIDFPVVYRAMAGLDSIAQSAGRCNREGRLPYGRVVVFVPPKPAPPGHLRKGEQVTRALFSARSPGALLTPDGFNTYFDLLYRESDLDEAGILSLLTQDVFRGEIAFRTAASRFQMVSDAGAATVLVPYGKGAALLEQLRRIGPERWLLRKLQRFGVTVHPAHLKRLHSTGEVREIAPGLFALVVPDRYDERFGLVLDELPFDLGGLVA